MDLQMNVLGLHALAGVAAAKADKTCAFLTLSFWAATKPHKTCAFSTFFMPTNKKTYKTCAFSTFSTFWGFPATAPQRGGGAGNPQKVEKVEKAHVL